MEDNEELEKVFVIVRHDIKHPDNIKIFRNFSDVKDHINNNINMMSILEREVIGSKSISAMEVREVREIRNKQPFVCPRFVCPRCKDLTDCDMCQNTGLIWG